MSTLPKMRMTALAVLMASTFFATASVSAAVTVAVSPSQVSLPANGTQQFAATVSGSSDQNVTWLVNGVPGGAPSLGTISSSGLYTAPAGASSSFTATVTAQAEASALATSGASVAVAASTYIGPVYYVSTSGNDSANGSASAPWRTIQYAMNSVPAGATVQVAGGTYHELVTITHSGSATAGYITLTSAPGQTATLDGTGLGIPQGQQGSVTLQNVSYVRVIGLQLQNYTSNSSSLVPLGLFVAGSGDHIEIRNNHIHNIVTTVTTSQGDAFGLAVYGTATTPISNLIIDGNELDHLTLGYSESLSVNGNVQNWQVTNNRVHDNNNIGIVAIGFEGTAPTTSLDQARNGWIAGNTVYNISSTTNPAYNNQPSADGIYVDGGTHITIEQNNVQAADLGIELASEHFGRVTSYVTARNNLVLYSNVTGISIGGYGSSVGGTDHCTIVNNTLFENDTTLSGSGEFQVQYHASNNLFANNVLYANGQGLLVNSPLSSSTTPVTLENDLFYTSDSGASAYWVWNNVSYTGLSDFQQASQSEANGLLADPSFNNTATPDLRLSAASPGIGSGVNLGLAIEGAYDYAGSPRSVGAGVIDRGAYQQ
ncbi:right-handed parallel beta-helix repeat-containing protein [Dyella choica]|nr:right-handed parallel beta-helix repeat-containing protein [Dyella choica]